MGCDGDGRGFGGCGWRGGSLGEAYIYIQDRRNWTGWEFRGGKEDFDIQGYWRHILASLEFFCSFFYLILYS